MTSTKSCKMIEGSHTSSNKFSRPYPLISAPSSAPSPPGCAGGASMSISCHRHSLIKSKSLSPPTQQRHNDRISTKYDFENALPSRIRSASLSCSKPFAANRVHHALQSGEDSSQSSLNLSCTSSGYVSGSSANSSVGGSNLNLSVMNGTSNGVSINGNGTQSLLNVKLVNNGNGALQANGNGVDAHTNGQYHSQPLTNGALHLAPHQQHQLPTLTNMAATASRRRTISSNSNG